jgi:hypothetical protein
MGNVIYKQVGFSAQRVKFYKKKCERSVARAKAQKAEAVK